LHLGERQAVKALDFMVNMKFNDSCIGFPAETKQYGCLVHFLCENITLNDAKKSISYNLWNGIVEDDGMRK